MRKYKNRKLPRGVCVDNGYVKIRIFHKGEQIRQHVGPVHQPGVLDEAAVRLNKIQSELRAGDRCINQKFQRWTIEKACDVFWELEGKKKESPAQYKKSLDLIKFLWSPRFVDSINEMDVKKFREHLVLKKGNSPSTANRYHTVVTRFFYALKEWKKSHSIPPIKLPENNPGADVKKADERPFRRDRVLTVQEFHLLFENSTPRLQRILIMAVNTFLRKKDLKGIDSKCNINKVQNELRGTQSKTKKPYVLPITSAMKGVIETPFNGKVLEFTNFRREFQQAVKKAGINDFTFHDLRRTGATHMLKNGADIDTVREFLGHADISMTQSYLHTSKDDKSRAGEMLLKFFDPFSLNLK